MIFVECTLIDLKGAILKGKMHKSFTEIGEFNSWYKSIKTDRSMILNIMRYNPIEKPSFKQVNDVRLLQVSREFAT
jgi:hypothetical protein